MEIYDHDRRVTYRATVDPRTRELDHLEVIAGDHIDDNMLRRVPVDRIRRVARAEATQHLHGSLTFTLPGGLSDPTQPGQVPTDEEVAELLRQGFERADLARLYQRNVRTVDRWIRNARLAFPDVPQATRGRKPNERKKP
ncbi:hypothetical protein [Micropruina sp.]|uniref:hypothetical protein n=1 Tax=Micropruina sp. TaxID=2737536 RepID=UPI0039E53E2A